MSKLRLLNVDFPRVPAKQLQRLKCGEIFYDSDNEICSFQLVCLLCKMKHFAFEDFSIHIRNVHSRKSDGVATACAEDEPQDNCSQFLREDESDEEVEEEEDPIANEDYNKQLRVCSFELESEPELEFQEDSDLHSELEMETTTATALAPSDFYDEDSDSEVEKQYVFKVCTFLIYKPAFMYVCDIYIL